MNSVMSDGEAYTRFGRILSWQIIHVIFSTVIFSFPFMQDGQLSVMAKVCALCAG